MKRFIIFIALFLAVQFIVSEKVSATHQYFRNINTSTGTRWNVAANWSLTSGGGATGTVPIVSDTVYIDANSNDTVLIYAAATCKTLIVTQAINMFFGSGAASFSLTVAGSVTFPAGMNFTPAGGLTNYSGSLFGSSDGVYTSNGSVFPNTFQLGGTSKTYNIADDWTVGTFSTVGSNNITINNNNIYCTNLITGGTSGTTQSGTTIVTMNGAGIGTAGTWSASSVTWFALPLILNSAGDITISGSVNYGGTTNPTLTYTAGTLIVTSSTLNVKTCILNLTGKTVYNFCINSISTTTGSTITMASGIVISGLFNTVKTAGTISDNTLLSSSGGTQRAFTLLMTGTQLVGTVVVTDMDCSAGQTIFGFSNTISNCINWKQLTAPRTVYGNL